MCLPLNEVVALKRADVGYVTRHHRFELSLSGSQSSLVALWRVSFDIGQIFVQPFYEASLSSFFGESPSHTSDSFRQTALGHPGSSNTSNDLSSFFCFQRIFGGEVIGYLDCCSVQLHGLSNKLVSSDGSGTTNSLLCLFERRSWSHWYYGL